MDYKALRGSQRAAAQKYANGGAVHSDAAEDKKMIDKAIREYAAKDKKQDADMQAEGMKRGGRLDKKPRSSKKDSVKINIINVPKSDSADPMASMKASQALAAPARSPMASAPAPIPAAMPTKMPPMRKCGGRT